MRKGREGGKERKEMECEREGWRKETKLKE